MELQVPVVIDADVSHSLVHVSCWAIDSKLYAAYIGVMQYRYIHGSTSQTSHTKL